MLRNIVVLLILLTINGAIMYGVYQKVQGQIVTVSQDAASHSVPDFHWKDFTGKDHTIKELSGKVVVIHFWATWCGPCRREFPELLKAASELGNNIVFLTISGDDRQQDAEKFIAKAEEEAGVKQPANVIYAFDPEKTIAYDIFQTAVYPESIIVDKSGNMRRKLAGTADWLNAESLDALKSYLN